MLSENAANSTAPSTEQQTEGFSKPGSGAASASGLVNSGPARVDIRVSDDKLKAWIAINPPEKPVTDGLDADFIKLRWREMGLDPEALVHETAQSLADQWNATHFPIPETLAAESAHPPVPGENARIESIINSAIKFKPMDQGGSVDFRNLNLIKPVRQGQPLAKKIPAGLGVFGIDLFGQPAAAPDGQDVEIALGANTEVSATDPNVIVASVAGFLQQQNGLASVNECFVVDGSVDYSTGNIEYEQSAMIRGDIADGFSVKVGGALEVGGAVGEARLQVGGDVLIKQGFVGSGHGLITAKGMINLGFSSNQCIRAHGDVVVEKESFNCQIFSRQAIFVYGPLVGGLSMACKEISCCVAGNDMGSKTELEAGMDYILHENKQLLEDKIKEMTAHLAKITLKLTRFREAYRTRKRFTSAEAKLMLELRDMQEKVQLRLPEMEKRRLGIVEKIRVGYLREGLCIKVEKRVNPGVVIKVGPEIFRVQEEMSGPKVFLYKEGRIKVF